MKVSFSYGLLNKPHQEMQSVYIRVKHNTLQFKRTLNLKMKKEFWDFKQKQPLKILPAYTVQESLDAHNNTCNMLNWYEREFYNQWSDLNYQIKTNGITLTSADWKTWCEKIISTINEPVNLISSTPKLTQLWEEFINLKKATAEESESTIKSYRDRLNTYEQFEKYKFTSKDYKKSVKHYRTDELHMKFYGELKAYFIHKKQMRLGRSLTELEKTKTLNYFGDFIKKIKAISKYYRGEGYVFHLKVFTKEFKAISIQTPPDILTPVELKSLWALEEMTADEVNTIKLTRILYYGCLRISDLILNYEKGFKEIQKNIEYKDNDFGDKVLYWTITQKKSRSIDRTKVVPIVDSQVCKMLTNSDEFPKVSKDAFNGKVSKLIQRCGIENKEITSHTFRRSILTNMYNATYPIAELMRFSGHKREQSLMIYIKKKNVNIPTKVRIDADGNFI